MHGQGSLEYLLIIGGGILVAVIILGATMSVTETGKQGTTNVFAQGVCAKFTGSDCYSQIFSLEGEELSCFLDTAGKCQAKSADSIRFVQLTDTHIITYGSCSPLLIQDGRTDCNTNLIGYTSECSSGSCQWINPENKVSVASNIALQDTIPIINELNPDFVIITGDLVASQPCNTEEGKVGKRNSYSLFKNILGGLKTNYLVIGAHYHDGLSNEDCRAIFVEKFGEGMKNWNFTCGKNLFIGLSETYETGNILDLGYLDSVLQNYANQGMKVFIFFHTQISCYDEIQGGNFRCTNNPDLRAMLLSYKDQYKTVITIGGHNHANIYEEEDGIHYFTTTATMNYPTQFRVVDIEKDNVHLYMSQTANSEIDALSFEIMGNAPSAQRKDPLVFFMELNQTENSLLI